MKKIKGGLFSMFAGVLLVASAAAQEGVGIIVSQRFLVESPRGSLYAIVPAMAFEVIPEVSFGASYHIVRGYSKYKIEIKSAFLDEFVFFAFNDRESYEG